MKLNPLIKIENLSEPKCIVKLLIDRKSYKVDRNLFVQLIDVFEAELSRESLQSKLTELLSVSVEVVSDFIDRMLENKILLETTDDYPIDQIEYWKEHKWLNALIYHLESQNIICFDDGTQKNDDNKIYAANVSDDENVWKTYTDCQVKALPPINLSVFDTISLEEVLLRRNSFSPFRKKIISMSDFSNILGAANRDLCQNRLKLEQSPKALYQSSFSALETYVFIFSIENIEPGIYHYQPRTHVLHLLRAGNFKNDVIDLCIGQRRAASGGCLFLLTGNPMRYMMRYKHERAYRNLLINVAEFAHQYVFYSTALEYSTFITPAIKDEYASELLNLTGFEELPLYTVAIG